MICTSVLYLDVGYISYLTRLSRSLQTSFTSRVYLVDTPYCRDWCTAESRPTQFSAAFTAQGLGDMCGSLIFSRFEKLFPSKPTMTAFRCVKTSLTAQP